MKNTMRLRSNIYLPMAAMILTAALIEGATLAALVFALLFKVIK